MGDFIANSLIDIKESEILSIHLLTDKDKFIIAVTWNRDNEQYFKMFRDLSTNQVKTFSDKLKNSWNVKINIWLNSTNPPLKLTAIPESEASSKNL